MIGELSLYAAVTVTPEKDVNLLSCENPLGVMPKLVHITTPDRTEGYMFDYACIPAFGGGIYGSGTTGYWRPVENPTGYKEFWITADSINVQRAGSSTNRWKAGVTYTVHIYA